MPASRLTRTLQRRPRGEAAQMILKALQACDYCDMTLNDLRDQTGLAEITLRDNVLRMVKQGKLEAFRDEAGATWVRVPE